MQTLPVSPQIGGNHYGNGIQPWDLQTCMLSTGDVFIDARRTDVIEYVFRLKNAGGLSTLQQLKSDAIKARHNLEAIIARIDQLEPQPMECVAMEAAPEALPYQGRVYQWLFDCFGESICTDKLERVFRFFEEAAELSQSLGMSYTQAVDLITYTWQRPLGDAPQEVGGVMVTLAALCAVHDMPLDCLAEDELRRVNRPEIKAKIRAKHAAKPAGVVSALPGIPKHIDLIHGIKCKECGKECESGYNVCDACLGV